MKLLINAEGAVADTRLMAGKTVLVTGGTSGIGKATAVGLARLGARVGITGRDTARAEAAAAEIRAASNNSAVDAFAADLSSRTEVRRLARECYAQLDVLVNNVGGFWAHRHLTADGLEHTFALNHLAPFLLTNLLLDRLIASAPVRVVTVSSGAHTAGRLDFDDLQGEKKYSGQHAYNASKLANVMFTYELARRLRGAGVTATVLHPGVVRTSFGAEDQAAFFTILSPLIRPFLKTTAQGAATSIYLASSAHVEGVTGQYFANSKPKKSSTSSYDTRVAGRLWQGSVDLVGLSTGPPKLIVVDSPGHTVPTSPLLQTKLYVPRSRPGLVSRARLIERLNQAVDGRLTILSAPAGFGKTTLLTQWLAGDATGAPPAAWVSLDQSDNEPTLFWAYLIAALQTVHADVGKTTLSLLGSPQLLPVETLLGPLLNEIAALAQRSVLVLDDYQVIDAQQIHQAIGFLIDHLPPQLHLVIASRADPSLPLSRLRARGQLAELRAVDLRFTADEAVTFLNDVTGLDLAEQEVTALEARTEGWIAGLQLAALSMRGREDVAGFISAFTGDDRYIVDYLVE